MGSGPFLLGKKEKKQSSLYMYTPIMGKIPPVKGYHEMSNGEKKNE